MRRFALALVVTLGSWNATARADEAPSPVPEPPTPATPEAQGAFEPGTPPFADLLAKAKANAKPVFLDFFTTWCGPCKMLERDVFPKDEVIAALKAFVCARYDAEKGEGLELAERYGVEGFPTLLVLDAEGKEIDRVLGYRPPEAFLREVARILRGENTLPAARKVVEALPDNLGLAIAFAGREMRSEPAAATRRLEGVIARAHGMDVEAEADALLALAAVARRMKNYELAAAHLERLLRDFAESKGAGKAGDVLEGLVFKLPAAKAYGLLEQARKVGREPEQVREVERLAYLWHQNEAAGVLKRWASAADGDGQALNEVAWTAFLQKMAPKDALTWAQKAVDLTERDPAILDTLANLLFLVGKMDEAIELEEEAVKKAAQPAHALEFSVNIAMWKAARDVKQLFAAREKAGLPAGREDIPGSR